MAGWLLTGAASIASAQSSSNTRQLLLFDAVRQNNLEQVRSIISAGIDVARPNAGGTTAVDLAVQNGHFGIAQHLILTRRLQQQSLTETVTVPAAA
ncbi:MAG: ankyrin repeat domain-containing protein, partial [Rhodospirillaceae bacterium]|nr:ankyrin repeat domain-containing protein [Rhodospirillaceae bacterium]